jgi:glucose/arabinose dehydrogenase
MAVALNGTIFVAERDGRMTIIADSQVQEVLRAAAADREEPLQLLSLALAPDFARNHLIFALYGRASSTGTAVDIARYREVSGQLGERAVIFQSQTSIPASSASAVIRFGPDGKLYVAFGGAEGNGWLMRLNPDGTTPGDAARASREILTGVQAPRGLDWDPGSQGLWLADENRTDSRLSTMTTTAAPVRAVVRGWRQLSGRAGPLTFYRSDAIPGLRGDAVMGSADGQLLRIRFDPADRTRVEAVETLFDPNAGPVRALAVSPDGALYFVTDSELGRLTVNGSARTSGH